jgi:hypothetical protein
MSIFSKSSDDYNEEMHYLECKIDKLTIQLEEAQRDADRWNKIKSHLYPSVIKCDNWKESNVCVIKSLEKFITVPKLVTELDDIVDNMKE